MTEDRSTRDLQAQIDVRGQIRSCSPALAEFLGARSTTELVGLTLDDLTVGSGRRTIVRAAADARMAGVEVGPVDLWLEAPSGVATIARFWVADAANGMFDITGHDLMELSEHERTSAVEAILLDRVSSGDPQGPVLRGLAQLIEWRLPGTHCSVGTVEDDEVIRHRHAPSLAPRVVEALDRMAPTDAVAVTARRGDGLIIHDDLRGDDPVFADATEEAGFAQLWTLRIGGHGDEVLGLLALFAPSSLTPDGQTLNLLRHAADIARVSIQRARSEREQMHASLHDPLTGLPNRRLLLERVAQAMARTQRGDRRTALLMVDLDDFKVANDSLSHEVGDRVLCRVADRLVDAADKGEVVGRFGGDEFLVVTSVRSAEEAVARAEHFRHVLDSAVSVASMFVRTAASIGVAQATSADTADSLLRDADAALHRAKRDGRNRVVLFDQTIRADMLERVETESALRRGIARREIEVHYQPIVDLETFDVSGAEALVRWRRDGAELLSPGHFVSVAEDSGLIMQLGTEVLEQAVGVAADLRTAGWRDLVISVNVSPQQLTPLLVSVVSGALVSAGLEPGGLCLEITESALAREDAEKIVRQLDEVGVRIAIDDFGTGYSSLNHLRRFPVADVLKIDASFVADIEGPEPSGQAIVSAAVVLGHSLSMEVTAEGVETLGQLQLLRELGCDHAQGYLMSPPVPAADLAQVLGQVVRPAESG